MFQKNISQMWRALASRNSQCSCWGFNERRPCQWPRRWRRFWHV